MKTRDRLKARCTGSLLERLSSYTPGFCVWSARHRCPKNICLESITDTTNVGLEHELVMCGHTQLLGRRTVRTIPSSAWFRPEHDAKHLSNITTHDRG